MIRKGNACPASKNAIFLNNSLAEKSRKSHNERFTLYTANFRTVVLSPGIENKPLTEQERRRSYGRVVNKNRAGLLPRN